MVQRMIKLGDSTRIDIELIRGYFVDSQNPLKITILIAEKQLELINIIFKETQEVTDEITRLDKLFKVWD